MTGDVLERYRLDQPLTEEEVLFIQTMMQEQATPQWLTEAEVAFVEREEKVYCTLTGQHERVDQVILKLAKMGNRLQNEASQQALTLAVSIWSLTLRLALAIWGSNNNNTLACLNNLAYCLQMLGRAQEALPLYEQALTACIAVLGEQHPQTLTSYNNLAGCLKTLGRAQEALPLYEQALTACIAVLGEQHPDTLRSYNNLALFVDENARSETEQHRAVEHLVKVARSHISTPFRYLNWFERVVVLADLLIKHINAGRLPVWQPLFDDLSQELTETLETQVEQLMDQAYQCFAGFHALYLSLCLRHGHTAHIPTVLARIHAPKLATLVWEKLAAIAPDSLSDVEREFIEVRRQLALRRLGAQLIAGGRDPDDLRPTTLNAEQAAAQERQFVQQEQQTIDTLLTRYRELRDQLGEQFRTLLHPGSAGIEDLQAHLAPGQALLLLIDVPAAGGYEIVPFALLLRSDSDAFRSVDKLSQVRQLGDLLAHNQNAGGQRGGYRRGAEERLTPETPIVSAEEMARTAIQIDGALDNLTQFHQLSEDLREEDVTEGAAFQNWKNELKTLTDDWREWFDMFYQAQSEPKKLAFSQEDYHAFVAFRGQIHQLIQQQPLLSCDEQARLMSKWLWQPLQTALGDALHDIDTVYWVTHGRLHTLPYELGRPENLSCRFYHYPGALFLRAVQTSQRHHEQTLPALVHTYHAPPEDYTGNDPIPFVLTDQAIAEYFLPTPQTNLTAVLSSHHKAWQLQEGVLSGHGGQGGKFYMGHGSNQRQLLAWQDWILRNIHLNHAYIPACLLGRTEEQHGDPMGWVAALLLQHSETVIAALAPISDFYTPLLSLLFYQARFSAKDRKSHPEDALREAKRRLLTGDWYEAGALQSGREAETTAALVGKFYRHGMAESVRLISGVGGQEYAKKLLPGWCLPKRWRDLLAESPPIRLQKAVRQDQGQALMEESLDLMIESRKVLGGLPEVQALVSNMVCFGKTR